MRGAGRLSGGGALWCEQALPPSPAPPPPPPPPPPRQARRGHSPSRPRGLGHGRRPATQVGLPRGPAAKNPAPAREERVTAQRRREKRRPGLGVGTVRPFPECWRGLAAHAERPYGGDSSSTREPLMREKNKMHRGQKPRSGGSQTHEQNQRICLWKEEDRGDLLGKRREMI